MGTGVGAVLPVDEVHQPAAAGSVPHVEPGDWQRAADRITDYLRAMGVREPQEIELLKERVRRRVEARASAPLEDPVEVAVEETHALLDLWLVAELGDEADHDALYAARAAVLGGGVPGWSARWAGLSGCSLAADIRALSIRAVPQSSPLTMEPNAIDLFLHRLVVRVRRFLCRGADRGAAARGHP
jgi:hypothetical protein